MTIDTKNLRDLLAMATERPWIVCEDPDDRGSREVATVGWFAEYAVQLAVATPGVPGGDYQNTAFGDPSTDAELTAEAVNSLPALLDQIDSQAAEIERLREVLKLAYGAMNYLGDVLNGMDAVEPEDEAATTPAFDAVRAALQEQPK